MYVLLLLSYLSFLASEPPPPPPFPTTFLVVSYVAVYISAYVHMI